jgi:hypothetical protein
MSTMSAMRSPYASRSGSVADMTRLDGAATLFVPANVLHTLDHLRTGLDRLAVEVLGAGTLLSVAAVLALRAREVAHPATA